MATVRFPDGTAVQAVGILERLPDKADRDYGLYLDARWRPTWNADVIEWEDFGLPSDSEAAAKTICQAFGRAKRGQRIEIGCIGGLGRTGTVLACMAILAGITPAEAVQWVRHNYDPAAIETTEQADWVMWFARYVRGEAHDLR